MRIQAALLALWTVAACTAAAPSPAARVLAAHNALDALGAVRLGPVREGALLENVPHRVEVALEARCYTIAAFASEPVRALSLSLLNDAGAELARGSQQDSNPTMRACVARAGRYQVALRSLAGSGAYALALWSGGGTIDRPALARAPYDARAGTCGAPIELALGSTVIGEVSSGAPGLVSRCVAEEVDRARSVVYRVEVPRPMRLIATLRGAFDGGVSIRSACGPLDAEEACAIFDEAQRASVAQAAVEPGAHFVVVDGAHGDDASFQLEVRGEPFATRAEACRHAEVLGAQPLSASFAAQPRHFDLECSTGAGAGAGQRVFRFDLERRARVRVSVGPPANGAAPLQSFGASAREALSATTVAFRRSCAPREPSAACQRAAGPSLSIERTLDAGPWFAVIERSGEPSTTAVTLELSYEGEPAGAGDRCADAIRLQHPIRGDTISMNDDVRSECSAEGASIDQVFRLDLREREVVTITPPSPLRAPLVLAWTDRCDALAPSALCARVTEGQQERFERVLDAGTHYLAVESAMPGSFLSFEMDVERAPVAPMERACAAAPLLPHGQRVRGAVGADDLFSTRCDGLGSPRPDRVYRLQLQRRSRVQIALSSEDGLDADGAPLFEPAAFVRAACALASSEVQCVSEATDTGRDALDPGTYFVIVTGVRTDGRPGHFSVRATVTPE